MILDPKLYGRTVTMWSSDGTKSFGTGVLAGTYGESSALILTDGGNFTVHYIRQCQLHPVENGEGPY